MAVLHNRVSRKELKERAILDNTPRTTISFYRYTAIPDPQHLRDEWYKKLNGLKVFGRIYIATEGVNAQINVPVNEHKNFIDFLNSQPGFQDTRLNKAVEESPNSFYVLDIKVRKKIVADGIEDPAFDMQNKGGYVNAEEFNKLTTDPETVIVDMRNHYEFEVGHFINAIEVPSDTFRDQLPMVVEMLEEKKDKNIIMYCTGGIRCEKASAWMLHKGFKNVFHLEGGIINYSKQVKEGSLENKFIGKNFVFDERLGERITDDILAQCHICGQPCDTHINCANSGCHLLFIQCESCKEKLQGCCSNECLDFINLPSEEQKERRKGKDKGRNIFNKSRQRMEEIKKASEKDT
ncbi:rhodanese-related sulfurtransferase [Pollutibacter soli]|uniref:oxygen-dependent tRNA uridine(34) hydroxylase TrhO n=1 Tax=Pollutibacter soli TaxID=3034157 RepID=UPI0030138006